MSTERNWTSALLDPEGAGPKGLTTWNGSDPAQRFAVYRNNIAVSLVDALADTYPVVQALVGVDFFRAMALRFVRLAPPASPVLALYCSDFPDFIADFAAARPLPYLADVARLEQAYVEAYHAADAAVIDPDRFHLSLSDPGQVANLRLRLHPSFRVVRSRFPIVSIWAAHQEAGRLSGIDLAAPESAWVMRNGLSVSVMSMQAGDCRFAESLQAMTPLLAAVNHALETDPAFDFGHCLAALIAENAVAEIAA